MTEIEFIKLLAQQGPSAVIAGVVVWFILNQFKALQAQLIDIVKANTSAMTEIQTAVRQNSEAITKLEEKLEKLN